MKNRSITLFVVCIILTTTITTATSEKQEGELQKNLISNNIDYEKYDESIKITSIIASDNDPFNAVIATPIAVKYDEIGNQETIPLFVIDFEEPSDTLIKTMVNINKNQNVLVIDDAETIKDKSLIIAKNFFPSSKGALIIKNNQEGYNLGVIAAPIASYLNIPIIVIDELDNETKEVLQTIGVEYSYVCGDVEGYNETYRFDNVEEIVIEEINIVKNKFGSVQYITITNPIDAREIVPLEKKEYAFETEVEGFSTLRLIDAVLMMIKGGGLSKNIGEFTIPNDYKYALIKLEGFNYNTEGVDKYGDSVGFSITSEDGSIIKTDTSGGIAERDKNGNIILDKCYSETVLYAKGGSNCKVNVVNPLYAVNKQGKVSVKITIEKLQDPVYPMMKDFSSLAPYLTAYHKGIIFGKPEFAFTADDDVLVEGETCPGFYMPRINTKLREPSNEHVFDIHEQINQLLAEISEIPVGNLEELRDHYDQNPVYIALIGGATVLPQISYDNVAYKPTNSDVIYGNIDPKHEWINTANDTYTPYPYQENIVGRIIAWDTQDASALIARTIFYDEVLKNYQEWKDRSSVLVGCCNDFQKNRIYRVIDFISKLTGMNLISRGEPFKWWNGYGEFCAERVDATVFEPMGFNSDMALYFEAMRKGISYDAIKELKYDTNLINRLFLNKKHLEWVSEDNVRGQQMIEDSNFIFFNAHGSSNLFTAGDVAFTGLGYGLVIVPFATQIIARLTHIGPFASLGQHTSYTIRGIENMDMGPSVMFLESCICGQIDGHHPKTIVSPTFVHAGLNTLIAASITSNVGGGYLEPKNRMYDSFLSSMRAYIKNKMNTRKGQYPDPHFGYLIHSDWCEHLSQYNSSVGLAYREARNNYLPQDANWTLWWAPPLSNCGESNEQLDIIETGFFDKVEKQKLLENKYTAFQEYQLYGDPAFNPYEP